MVGTQQVQEKMICKGNDKVNKEYGCKQKMHLHLTQDLLASTF
jgi:hypothetical protein